MEGRPFLPVLCCLILVSTVSASQSQKEKDEVHNLPGLEKQPDFKHYSGYLYAGETKRLHYWFAESQSSPSADPLLLWLNGGPGCSSMQGFLTINGPFMIQGDGKTLRVNPYAWNRLANTLYIESPVGVGYSYDEFDNITVTDNGVAMQNYLALKDFFKRFPELDNRPTFLTGESYAGIYVPTLWMLVKEDPAINLKGAAIGNGLLDSIGLVTSQLKYFYYHGITGADDWAELTSACCHDNKCVFLPFPNTECQDKVGKAMLAMWAEPINQYNIHADCLTYGGARDANRKQTAIMLAFLIKQIKPQFDDPQVQASLVDAELQLLVNDPCTDYSPQVTYLNSAVVREALHIPERVADWVACSDTLKVVYTTQYTNVRDLVLSFVNDKKYSLLFYNGDLDTVCDFFGDEAFVDSLGLKEKSSRQPWYYIDVDGYRQIGGFVHEFEGLEYKTIRGAGHMSPADQPVATFQMLQKFLSNAGD